MNAVIQRLNAARSEVVEVKVSLAVRAAAVGSSIKLKAYFEDDVVADLCSDKRVVEAVADAHVLKEFKHTSPNHITEALESNHGFDQAVVARLAAMLWWTYCESSLQPAEWHEFRMRWRPRWETIHGLSDDLSSVRELARKVLGVPGRFFTPDRLCAVKVRSGGIVVNSPCRQKIKESRNE